MSAAFADKNAGIDKAVNVAGITVTGADAAPFLTDQRRVLHGQALAVARPADAEGVAAVLRLCRAARVPVVAQSSSVMKGMKGCSRIMH